MRRFLMPTGCDGYTMISNDLGKLIFSSLVYSGDEALNFPSINGPSIIKNLPLSAKKLGFISFLTESANQFAAFVASRIR